MAEIMKSFHAGLDEIAGMKVLRTEDYSAGLNGLPASDVLKYFYKGNGMMGSMVIRPSGTEPKLKAYISVIRSRDCGKADHRRTGEKAEMNEKEVHICPILMRIFIWEDGKCTEDCNEEDCPIQVTGNGGSWYE